MAKRLIDIALASFSLIACAPIVLLAGLAIVVSNPGPIFYRPWRIGLHGRRFRLLKLRSMRVTQNSDSKITSSNDRRVFAVGRFLRATKIDELPQLWNVLTGDMSLVGPRPEDPQIVADHYDELGWQSLQVRPGLAGVSSIYNYTHGEALIGDVDPETDYVERLLPTKLALEAVYLARQSLFYDFGLMLRTLQVLFEKGIGKAAFAAPPEWQEAQQILSRHQTSQGRRASHASVKPPHFSKPKTRRTAD